MDRKQIVIFGGGTVSHVRSHLALCAPAYGGTARRLAGLARTLLPDMDVNLQLTRMAGGPVLETNEDVARKLSELVRDDVTKVIIMSAAMCDFHGSVGGVMGSKQAARLHSRDYLLGSGGHEATMSLSTAEKVVGSVRKARKDIFLVGFKTTSGVSEDETYLAGLNLCKRNSCNLVFANDIRNRVNMVITPEEARYHVSGDRDETERGLMEMVFHRTHLTFTRSTVVGGNPVAWSSAEIPQVLREVVEHCIDANAYKPFNGVTAGHFACKLSDTTFLTSIRKTNFNDLAKNGMVRIVTDGPDTVLAYGAKPSVGGQSQRIVFHDHPGLDCIVHFHCPKLASSGVPTVSQREFECGSHECGQNTSKGLKKFGNVWAVYLDNHGPNIVFDSRITTSHEVIEFIRNNFDLSEKTGGFVSIKERLETPNTIEDAMGYLGLGAL